MHWINKIKSFITRNKKSRTNLNWLSRWDNAVGKCWKILTNGEISIERYERFERNHNRLTKLIENKLKGFKK